MLKENERIYCNRGCELKGRVIQIPGVWQCQGSGWTNVGLLRVIPLREVSSVPQDIDPKTMENVPNDCPVVSETRQAVLQVRRGLQYFLNNAISPPIGNAHMAMEDGTLTVERQELVRQGFLLWQVDLPPEVDEMSGVGTAEISQKEAGFWRERFKRSLKDFLKDQTGEEQGERYLFRRWRDFMKKVGSEVTDEITQKTMTRTLETIEVVWKNLGKLAKGEKLPRLVHQNEPDIFDFGGEL